MKDNKVVTINGQKYDSVTGKPIGKPNSSVKRNIHEIKPTNNHPNLRVPKSSEVKNFSSNVKNNARRSMDIARSKSISRFTRSTTADTAKATASMPSRSKGGQLDIAPARHPLTARVDQIRTVRAQATAKKSAAISKPAKKIKEEAIAEAMKKADDNKKTEAKKPRFIRFNKPLTIGICSFITLIIIGLTTYLFMPSMSVYVASAQAQIDAKYPTYVPDGYHINGPVSYESGKVVIGFAATAGTSSFKITQNVSSWDSSALKNQVNSDSKGEFITINYDGLTIFNYENKAAWVNNGMLYSISGDAPLSSSQIQKIAISLCE